MIRRVIACAVLATSAACSVTSAIVTRAPVPHPAPRPVGELVVAPDGGDVWALTLQLRSPSSDLRRCWVEIEGGDAGVTLPATVEAGTLAAEIPIAEGPNDVVARCEDASGRRLVSTRRTFVGRLGPDLGMPADAPVPSHAEPPPGVVYGVHPPLHGAPPLQATTRALAGLRDLGVDVVWLSPIFESPDGDYGYAVSDPFRVRARFGTEEDLDALVREAHALGLRVVLDVVPNHLSERHPYVVDARTRGPSSRTWSFLARDDEGRETHYFDWKNLPNLSYASPEVRAMMRAMTAHWLARGVDGFRVDAAWGVKERAPDFWKEWTRDVRARKPDALLFAEAPARDPYWIESGFDAAYDWSEELGHAAWEHAFDGPGPVPAKLRAALEASRARTSVEAQAHVLRFLDNNDTGERFVTRHGAGMTRAATAALLTLPGVPALFSGSEVGAAYLPYGPKVTLDGSDPNGLRPWTRAFVHLRNAIPALRSPTMTDVAVKDASVLAFTRGDDDVLVVIGFDGHAKHVRVPLPRTWRGALVDLRTGAKMRTSYREVVVDLDAWGAAVIAPR